MIWDYKTSGVPDELFDRGEVPITKAETRAISISKLKLYESCNVLDIGCGTGSVTVEAALQCVKGMVVGVDKDIEAVELTKRNIEKFGLINAKAFNMDAEKEIPEGKFDRIFIGGGGSGLSHIIETTYNRLEDNGIIVVNTILIESTYKALNSLEQCGFKDIECVSVNISKGIRVSGWMMKAFNPVFIISGYK